MFLMRLKADPLEVELLDDVQHTARDGFTMAKHLSKHNVGIIANPNVGGHGVGHPESREGGGRGGGSGSSHVIGWA